MAFGITTTGVTTTWKPTIMATLKTAVESEGWTTLENSYNDGTYTRWVFRNTNSDFAIMFFCATVALNTEASNSAGFLGSNLYFCIGEEYDTGARELKKLASWWPMASASDCTIGSTGYTPTKIIADGTSGPGCNGFSIWSDTTKNLGGADQFWYAVTEDNLLIGSLHNTSTKNFIFGHMESLVHTPSSNDPVCIGVAVFQESGSSNVPSAFRTPAPVAGSAGGQATFTRSAMNPSSGSHVWVHDRVLEASSDSFIFASSTGNRDKYQDGDSYLTRIICTRNLSTLVDASLYGFRRAAIPASVALFCWEANASNLPAARFDEVTVGSDTYVYFGSLDSGRYGVFGKKDP